MAPPKKEDDYVAGLKGILSEIAQLQVAPEADIQGLSQLNIIVMDMIMKAGAASAQKQAQEHAQGNTQGPTPMGGPGQPVPPPGMDASMMGIRPSQPNMDEFARMLQGASGAGGMQ